jgi:hypothetical protein
MTTSVDGQLRGAMHWITSSAGKILGYRNPVSVASEVDICNLALSALRRRREHRLDRPARRQRRGRALLDLLPDRARPAARADAVDVRDAARDARRGDQRPRRLGLPYALPTGCIKPRIVLPEGYTSTEDDGVPFEREGDSIYADESGATLVYTFRQTDPTKFNPGFVTALSWLLASYISGPIVKDPTGRVQAALYQRWEQRELPKAAASNIATTRTRATYTPTAQRAPLMAGKRAPPAPVSFAGGEIAPEMFGRIDLDKMQTGLAKAENFRILPHGPVQNRAGYQYVLETKRQHEALAPDPVRLLGRADDGARGGRRLRPLPHAGQTLLATRRTSPRSARPAPAS